MLEIHPTGQDSASKVSAREDSSRCDSCERRVRRVEQKVYAVLGLCLALAAFVVIVPRNRPKRVSAAEEPLILHAKGLVIEDSQGRARILLGAPFPVVPDRVRRDETAQSMLFLDEQGHDRFSIGEKMAPQIAGSIPQNYRKLATSYGLTLYDGVGNERGGMGFISDGSNVSRAVFGLDRPQGDAIGAIVDDKTGYAGLVAMYPPRAPGVEATGILLGTQGKKAYLSLQDAQNRPGAALSVGDEVVPTFQTFDRKGQPGPNLLEAARQ